MKLSKWMTGILLTLFVAGTAAAGSYQQYQAEFLEVAAQEEAAEDDFRGERDFLALADEAGRQVVTLADAPEKWRDKLKLKRANRAAMGDSLSGPQAPASLGFLDLRSSNQVSTEDSLGWELEAAFYALPERCLWLVLSDDAGSAGRFSQSVFDDASVHHVQRKRGGMAANRH